MQLKGKKVLVTGGTSGIGRAIALLFVQEGADVIIWGTQKEKAEKTLAGMEKNRVSSLQKIAYFLVDVADTKAVEEVMEKTLAVFEGGLEILVNSAGITRDKLLLRMTEEDWDLVLGVNLKSLYNTTRLAIKPMMKARKGKIINISSVIGLTGNAGQMNYSASKAGMIGFTKSLAKELASRAICANCIAPGYIDTLMTHSLPEAVKEATLKMIPLGRMGMAEEIAQAALFLAGEGSNYITGQTIVVDGGMVM